MRLLLLAWSGCHSIEPLNLPVVGSAVLMAIIGVDDAIEISAFAPGDRPEPFALSESSELVLLSYGSDLETLGILPGRVPMVRDEPSRPLPRALSIQRASVGGGELSVFTEIFELPAELTGLRIRGLTVSDCGSRGGCYESLDRALDNDCTLPCPGEHGPTSTVAPPLLPEAPRFDVCPDGFVREDIGGAEACTPPERVSCSPGQVQLVGALECAPLGAPCPNMGFHPSVALADPNVLFVRPGATGNGTSANPFGTIDEALVVATRGQTVALSLGTHAMSLPIPGGVHVIGACAEGTIIEGMASPAADASIEAATLRRIVVPFTTSLTVLEVIAEGPTPIEVYGRIDGDHLVVRGAPMFSSGAGVVLSESLFFDGMTFDQSTGDFSRIYVRGGPGIRGTRTTFILKDSLVEDVVENAINFAMGSLTLDGVRVRNTTPSAAGYLGHGVYFAFGSFIARRTVVDDAFTSGIWVFVADAIIEDVVIARIGSASGGSGAGLNIQDSQATIRRAHLARTTSFGVGLSEQPNVTNAVVEDIVVEDLEARDGEEDGAAFAVGAASSFSVKRALVRASMGGALRSDLEADVTVEDLTVENTGEPALFNPCILLARGTTRLMGRRIAIRDVRRSAVCAEQVANVTLEDIELDSVDKSPVRLFGAEVSINRGQMSALSSGVFVNGGHLELGDVAVRQVMAGSCLELMSAASLQLSRFRLSGCPTAGISGSVSGEVEVSKGLIEQSPVGVDVDGDPRPFIVDVVLDTDIPVRD